MVSATLSMERSLDYIVESEAMQPDGLRPNGMLPEATIGKV